MNWSGGTVSGGPLTVAGNGVLNLEGNGTVYLQNGALTNAGTVNWLSGGLNLYTCGSPATGPVVNLAGALWNIQCDQGLGYNCGLGTNGYFQNAGTVQKSAGTGTTTLDIPFYNSGVVEALQGTLNFQATIDFAAGNSTVGAPLFVFGASATNAFGQVEIAGNAAFSGAVSLVYEDNFVPAISNSFALITYGSHSGTFSNLTLPAPAMGQLNYGPATMSLLITYINSLAFTEQPVGAVAGTILPPVTVQVEDAASGEPVAAAGIPVTLFISRGSGPLGGTVTQNTDTSGKATFNDLSINLDGPKTLQASAAAAGLTPAVSRSFLITASTPAQLVLNTPIPSPQQAGTAFSPAPIVLVLDSFGNLVSNSTALVSANLSSGMGGHLAGTTSVSANGMNGSALFSNLFYHLGNSNLAEPVVVYFSSPGLVPATNSPLMVDFVFGLITLSNQNSVVRIQPATDAGLFSWEVDGANQAYQHWFWLRQGSTGPQASLDTFGAPLGLAYSPTNAAINYLAQGLNVVLNFNLSGGAAGSLASDLGESVALQNTSGAPITLHVFEYCDFDLAGNPDGDLVSFPSASTVVQQGKGMTLTETVQPPWPDFWEASWYAITLDEIESGSPITLSDKLIPAEPGDQTYAYQWDLPLGAGQTAVLGLAQSIRGAPSSLGLLHVAFAAGSVVLSWPTNVAPGAQLQSSTSLGPSAIWTVVTTPPMVVEGQFQLSLPPAGNACFYRLKDQ
jgi:hypothetical protein